MKILLTLFCFQEEKYQKNSLKNNETPKTLKSEDNSNVFIKKSVMEKYKNFIIMNFFINFSNVKIIYQIIFTIINTEKLKSKKILDKIVFLLPDDFINKINIIDKNYKNKQIKEIEKENKKEEIIKYEDNKLCLKFLNEFEIISNELYIYFEGQDNKLCEALIGNYKWKSKNIFV